MRGNGALSAILAVSTITCVSEPEWRGTIEERDGVVYVRSPREGIWQGHDTPPIRFELEQVFGVDTEPEDEILGAINLGDVTVDGVGNVYVFDYQASQLLSFAPGGSLRWRVGRDGQGPGEFSGVEGIAWDGGSTVWVANANLQRLDRWNASGEHLGADL